MGFYRFVGSESVIGERKYDAFGQRAEFSDEQYAEVVRGRGPFISETVFESLNFDQAELDKLANPWGRDPVTAETKEKMENARAVFRGVHYEATASAK